MSLTDRQSDGKLQWTDRGADKAEKWSDVMPFGRADPIPHVSTPTPQRDESCGLAWIGKGGCDEMMAI